ncbi:MAG: N-acetylmuramoyl-L-alanine amidase [Clostridia bacterium]|nr:N-acetylmuramoyl-L-alanine amidase [Clostridia bacterium]
MEIKSLLANQNNYGGKRSASAIQYIVIHYTANDGDRAASNGKYFRDNIVNASAHYFVDDTEIIQSVPDHCVAWSVGGDKYPSCATTGGGQWHGKCNNNNSISIELCDTKKNGVSDFTEATLKNGAELCKMLMKKYKVPIENVILHFDVVGKICPKPFVENKAAWKKWKERLVEDEMVEQVKIIIDGKTYEVNRILKDGTNYVKIRDIADAVGYEISSKGSIPVLTKK